MKKMIHVFLTLTLLMTAFSAFAGNEKGNGDTGSASVENWPDGYSTWFSAPYKGVVHIWQPEGQEGLKKTDDLTLSITGKAAEEVMKSLKEEPHMHRGLLVAESADHKISCEVRDDGTLCQIDLKR